MTADIGYAVIGILYVLIILTVLLFVSSFLFDHESASSRSSIRRIGKYLGSEPVALAFAALICFVYLYLAVTGNNEHFRVEYGLPNDNAWAYVGYAFLHADILHLIGNVGLLLICGGLIEDKLSRGWFLVFIVVCIPLGGYLSVLAAPIFIDSPWDNGVTSVGFSIVGNAIFVLCAYLVIVGTVSGAWFKQIVMKTGTSVGLAWTGGPSAILGITRARITLTLKECHLQLNPLKWSARTNRVATLALFFLVFSLAIDEGSPESVLGHSVGLGLGSIAVGACLLRLRFRSKG